MGFLTTITIRNDHLQELKDNPDFARQLFDMIDEANFNHEPVNHSGLIVQHSRHADDHTVFVHYGNSVIDLGGRRMDRLVNEMPNVAKDYVRVAASAVSSAKKKLKKALTKTEK